MAEPSRGQARDSDKTEVRWAVLAPLDGFLVRLAQGWRLPFVVEPCGGHHRHYSVLLEREDRP